MYRGGLRAADGGVVAPELSGQGGRGTSDTDSSALVTASASSDNDVQEFSLRVADRSRLRPVADYRTGRTHWQRRYQVKLGGLDLLAVMAAVAIGYLLRFGPTHGEAIGRADIAFSVLLPLFWMAVLAVNGAYEARFVGVGATEFERVFRAFLHVTVLTAFVAFATKTELARGFVIAVLPLALVLDLLVRYAARKRLHRRRAAGSSLTSVLAVGDIGSLAGLTEMLRRDQYAGMRVVGACTPRGSDTDSTSVHQLADLGVPVLGDADSVLEAARFCGADTVAVLSGEVSADKLRWISWQLEGTDINLVVSPGLTEVGGRRLHIQPVAGLPLLHVDEPEFTGFRRTVKGAFDRTVAALALLVLGPVLLGTALLVRCTSKGPALFRQVRVGRDGRIFHMVKFRSMCVDAEQRRADLVDQNECDSGPMFKIRDDPRVTRVGRVLRRFSIDELPQLLNVLGGSMSLVGPRPPLPDEVAQYGDDVQRRLLVKPGLTGLWQISGRSNLSWEESVRLDLRYVENWSLALDVVVLLKTGRAVFRAAGAY